MTIGLLKEPAHESRAEVLQTADLLLTIHQPASGEISGLSGKVLIGVFQPLFNVDQMKTWAAGGITSFSLDMLPRTTRAQAMDVLSSQANIAGYKAVMIAADKYQRFFPMLMTFTFPACAWLE